MATKKTLGYAAYRLSPLKSITARAKKLQSANKSLTWKAAIKKASEEYKKGKSKAAPVSARKPAKKAVGGKKIAVAKGSIIGEGLRVSFLVQKRTEAEAAMSSVVRQIFALTSSKGFLNTAIEKKRISTQVSLLKLALKSYKQIILLYNKLILNF